MNQRDYMEIAGAGDELLRSGDTSIGRLALPLLHVINEHPTLLRQYEPLLDTQVPAATAGARSSPAPNRSGIILQRAARALRRAVRPPPRPVDSPLPEYVNVLIISHVTTSAQVAGPDDFYFGALQRMLTERGATSVVALVDHLPPPQSPGATGHVPTVSGSRLLLPRTLPPAAELRLWALSVITGRRLLRAARKAPTPLQGALANLAGRQALSGVAMQNLRLHCSIAALCQRLRPRMVITTYEGDASERIIWHAARQHGCRPLCVGYQHTPMRQHAYAIRRRVNAPGLDCDPDVILTLGKISNAALARSAALQPVRLITYGSHRQASVNAAAHATGRKPICLVLPDADPREYDLLFKFAHACARLLPAMTFLLRPHPGTQADPAALRSGDDGEVPANLLLSADGTLEQQCARARFCLYRGSSAVLQAVLAGLKPFYLAQPMELSFDPLYQLDGWREIVTTPAELCDRVAAGDNSPESQAAVAARRFCEGYMSPVRPEAIDTLLALSATTNAAPAAPQ